MRCRVFMKRTQSALRNVRSRGARSAEPTRAGPSWQWRGADRDQVEILKRFPYRHEKDPGERVTEGAASPSRDLYRRNLAADEQPGSGCFKHSADFACSYERTSR